MSCCVCLWASPSTLTHTHTQTHISLPSLHWGRSLCECERDGACLTFCAGSLIPLFLLIQNQTTLSFSFLVSLGRKHDRHSNQHAAKAASYLLHPADHHHHPLWCAGAVRRRDGCKEMAFGEEPHRPFRLWQWLLLSLPKWVSCPCLEVQGQRLQ